MKKIIALLPLLLLVSCSTPAPQKTAVPSLPAKAASKTPTQEQVSAIDTSYELFNSPYKQLLFWTNQSDETKVKEYFSQAKTAWNLFFTTYKSNQPSSYAKSTDWESNLVLMQTEFYEAGDSIEKGILTEAHEHLEKVRVVWFAMRKENGLKTFADDLFTFHASMEATLLATDKESFVKNYTQLKADALALQSNPPLISSQTDKTKFSQLHTALEAELAKTENAIQENADLQTMKTSATGIKPAFTKLYLQFG